MSISAFKCELYLLGYHGSSLFRSTLFGLRIFVKVLFGFVVTPLVLRLVVSKVFVRWLSGSMV